jgi:hypothetical protein
VEFTCFPDAFVTNFHSSVFLMYLLQIQINFFITLILSILCFAHVVEVNAENL